MLSLRFDVPAPRAPKVTAAFLSAPRLSRVKLRGRGWDNASMPWAQLERLTLHCGIAVGGLNSLVATLAKCSNLVFVSLKPTGSFAHDQESRPSGTLAQLTTMHIAYVSPDLLHALQCLAFPALKTLKFFRWHEIVPSADFTPLLLGSLNIQHLILDIPALATGDLVGLLRCTPALTRLEYAGRINHNDDAFFGPTVNLVPKLEYLSLERYPEVGEDLDEENLRAMIASRWWVDDVPTLRGVARLKRVSYVGQRGTFGKKFMEAMYAYHSEGLDVSVVW
ncbi:hypothetical protein B0H11DRAFT_1965587 [Mycena galericulata]|nr:hypothetical protein B0H11DRAFT_1965587 [Mycena galericulata]